MDKLQKIEARLISTAAIAPTSKGKAYADKIKPIIGPTMARTMVSGDNVWVKAVNLSDIKKAIQLLKKAKIDFDDHITTADDGTYQVHIGKE